MQYPQQQQSQQYPQQYPQQQQYSQQYPYIPENQYGQQSQQYGQQNPQQGYLQPDIPVGQPVNQYPNQQYGYQSQPVYQPQPIQQSNIRYNQHPQLQTANGCPFPVQITCPYCKTQVGTIVETRVGDHTLIASCIVLILCWPLFWIPCVMDDCKDRVHLCPNCRHEVGSKKYEMC